MVAAVYFTENQVCPLLYHWFLGAEYYGKFAKVFTIGWGHGGLWNAHKTP